MNYSPNVKRAGRKRSAILATLVTAVIFGIWVLAYVVVDGAKPWVTWTLAAVIAGFFIGSIIAVWRFFFGIFIDKLFS